ncbi:MAG: outer membrane lipoprotein-sorting protein [Deltaproteobacteria bacterium]|nr:outer membrane lipoprotein-sorting protein [Deltaproteobacteria bacterium]
MKRLTSCCALGAALAISTLPSAALADEAHEILAKVDAAMTKAKDQTSTLTMVLEDAEGKTKERRISLQQKGTQLKMMKFLSPAEVKGVGFLTVSDDEMYLYMPEFDKVRRIASHLKNDTFMGTDFSYGDMGSISYAPKYSAKLIGKDAARATLELTPKKGQESPYGKLTMVVNLERNQPTRVEHFDKAGQLWKVMEYDQVEKIAGRWVPRSITMRDLKKKHATRMEMADIAFDTGLKDSAFSQRMLKRAR